jgi:hypothetical protein
MLGFKIIIAQLLGTPGFHNNILTTNVSINFEKIVVENHRYSLQRITRKFNFTESINPSILIGTFSATRSVGYLPHV